MNNNTFKMKMNPSERPSSEKVNEMIRKSKMKETDMIPFRINHNTVIMIPHDKYSDEFKNSLLCKYGV